MTCCCYICHKEICKYRMDLGDTILINNHQNLESYICDFCAKHIAKELIER